MKLFTTTLLAALLSVPSFATSVDTLNLNLGVVSCGDEEDHGDCGENDGGCCDHILVAGGGCGGCDDGGEGGCGEGEGEGNDSKLISHGCGDEEGDCDGEGHGEDSILVAGGGCGGCDDGGEGGCGEGEGEGNDSVLLAHEEGEEDGDCDGGSCPLPGSIA